MNISDLSASTVNVVVAFKCAKLLVQGAWYLYKKTDCYKARQLQSEAEAEVQEVFDALKDKATETIDGVAEVTTTGTVDTMDKTNAVRRKVKRKHRGSFRAYLVRIGKAHFGNLTNTQANRLCVRKFLYDACVDHGVLARHIIQHVDIATELVFVPTDDELRNCAVHRTNTVKRQLRLLSWFSRENNVN
jgi:hypothetical protein